MAVLEATSADQHGGARDRCEVEPGRTLAIEYDGEHWRVAPEVGKSYSDAFFGSIEDRARNAWADGFAGFNW